MNLNVVIIDDEFLSVSYFLQLIADDTSISCKHFWEKPESLLEYAALNPIDIAFLDIQMPKTDGATIARELIKLQPNIKIVFVSAFPSYEDDFNKELKQNYLGFCTKPYTRETLYVIINSARTLAQNEQLITIKTFGRFNVFVNGINLDFPSAKSKELLAFLVHNRGLVVDNAQIIDALWPDKDVEHGKRLFRDTCFRLRRILSTYNIQQIFEQKRCRSNVKTEGISCDYWDFLKDNKSKTYKGEYLIEYDWSLETQEELCDAIGLIL